MVAAEFVATPECRCPAPRDCAAGSCANVSAAACSCSAAAKVAVRFCPALSISEQQIDAAVAVFRDAVAAVAGGEAP